MHQINRSVLRLISGATTLPGINPAQGNQPSSDWQMSDTVREIRLNYA